MKNDSGITADELTKFKTRLLPDQKKYVDEFEKEFPQQKDITSYKATFDGKIQEAQNLLYKHIKI